MVVVVIRDNVVVVVILVVMSCPWLVARVNVRFTISCVIFQVVQAMCGRIFIKLISE